MNVLVTGHMGFVGQNLYEHLQTLENIDTVYTTDVPWNWEDIEEKVKKASIIFHQGAITDTLNTNLHEMMEHNYNFSVKLFDLVYKYRKRVIFASSAGCYDKEGKEGSPLATSYAWSKYAAEKYGRILLKNQFVGLRYFNVYGPHEEHKGKMASMIYQIYKNKSGVKLFPCSPQRDFVYVKDVVRANIHAAFSDMGGVFDVGSGTPRLFEDICDIMNIPWSYYKEEEVPSFYQNFTQADSNKFFRNWGPHFTLETGIKDYMEYLNETT